MSDTPTGSRVPPCARAGAHPIDEIPDEEIPDDARILAGMTAAIQVHSRAQRPSGKLAFNNGLLRA
jgi:hypothetical protein